jgi:hypothetical protein
MPIGSSYSAPAGEAVRRMGGAPHWAVKRVARVGSLGIAVLNEVRSEEKSVDEPNDNDGDQNEYPVGN